MPGQEEQHQQQSAGFEPIGNAVNQVSVSDFQPTDEIDSLCMQCHEQGKTRMLLTSIPYFKEVIVVSFRCEHCGYQNNDIQSAGQIQEQGALYTVKVTERDDLDRQLIKSDFCSVAIPEYQLQIPPAKGQFTTIEGIISDTVRDLSFDQPLRKVQQPEVHDKIEQLLGKLRPIVDDAEDGQERPKMPVFTIKLDDPSGNSFIETRGGLSDPKWSKKLYQRTKEQDELLGLAARPKGDGIDEEMENPEEVMSFPAQCSLCGSELETYMKTLNIPHFKDVIIMSTNCHNCGYRDNEIKSGGAVAPMARRITLKVEDVEDLSRDILKSDTASLTIPEIDLELREGTLGGRFTTLEGLLSQVYEELDEKVFAHGDSAASNKNANASAREERDGDAEEDAMKSFLRKLKAVQSVEFPYTVVVDDALSNSYVQNLWAPEVDPQLQIEDYERTHEQNEELGLNDMVTEGYEAEQQQSTRNTA